MNWRTAWRRLQRWTAANVSGRLVAALRAMAAEAGWDTHMLDSAVVRARYTRARALGRSGAGSRPNSISAAMAVAGRWHST
jgi:hypothetical protein